MSSIVMKLLLGQGLSKLQEVIMTAVRHGLTTLGGILSVHGIAIADNDMNTVIGAIGIVLGVIMSLVRTFSP